MQEGEKYTKRRLHARGYTLQIKNKFRAIRVGVPIGTPDFVHAYVRANAVEIRNDVQKLSIIKDPKIHCDLLRFCQHTRLGFLGRNLPPEVMMT